MSVGCARISQPSSMAVVIASSSVRPTTRHKEREAEPSDADEVKPANATIGHCYLRGLDVVVRAALEQRNRLVVAVMNVDQLARPHVRHAGVIPMAIVAARID